MPILRGFCQEAGNIDRLEIIMPAPVASAETCPMCGQFQVCDVRWVDDVFSEYDMDRIRSDDDIHPNHNVYPGGSPGRFQPHLVVFVDHPNFDFAQLEETLRRRIRLHRDPETRTLSVLFVSLTKTSMMTKMRAKHFRPMVSQWRWMDPTFAPTIHFRTSNWSWQSRVF